MKGELTVVLRIEAKYGGVLPIYEIFNSAAPVEISGTTEREIKEQLQSSLQTALVRSSDELTVRKKLYQRFFDAAGGHRVAPCSSKEPECLEFREMYQVLKDSKADITLAEPKGEAKGIFRCNDSNKKLVFYLDKALQYKTLPSTQIVLIDLTEVGRPGISCR